MIDLIGDIHGHYQELQKILKILGYSYLKDELSHPENRKIGFVGDFINRGPQSVEVLTLVKSLCESGKAITVWVIMNLDLFKTQLRVRKYHGNINLSFRG